MRPGPIGLIINFLFFVFFIYLKVVFCAPIAPVELDRLFQGSIGLYNAIGALE
jgi:hypothetical protein